MRVVMKFGGTSVGGSSAIRQVVEIVRDSGRQHQVAIVVSAMNAPDLRTTDTLIKAAQAAAAGDGDAMATVAPRLVDLHMRAAADLVTPDERAALEDDLLPLFDYISNLARSIAVQVARRQLALRSAGFAAEAVDATDRRRPAQRGHRRRGRGCH
jgi:aspartate kinase